MSITSPLDLPEAVVAIAVEGVDSLGAIKGKKYPLNVDEVEETTWQALSGRVEERDSDNTLVRIYLGDGLDAVSNVNCRLQISLLEFGVLIVLYFLYSWDNLLLEN